MWAMLALRWGILLAVTFGVGRRIWLEKEKLAAYDLSLAPAWLGASGACYLLGLTACAVFWWLAMRDAGARPTWASTLAAYFAGHLGKYVPGKGLVLVIRAAMARGPGVGAALAAVTAAQETTLMMATGATVAAGLLVASDSHARGKLLVATAGLSIVLGVVALPPVAFRLWRAANKAMPNWIDAAVQACRWRTFFGGAVLIGFGWVAMGLSLAAVLAAMGEPVEIARQWRLVTAAVALATVGGFVSLTPGGLGSREWILIETLGPVIGSERAVISAVVLRLVWIAAETLAAGTCWLVDRQWKRPSTEPS